MEFVSAISARCRTVMQPSDFACLTAPVPPVTAKQKSKCCFREKHDFLLKKR